MKRKYPERNDPMSPEKIASHEPTAVKRDKNQGTSGEPVTPFFFELIAPTPNGNIFKSYICNRCGTSFNSEDELSDHCRTMWH